jgi:chromosome segregation ATPase
MIEYLKATVEALRRNGQKDSSNLFLQQSIQELEALLQKKGLGAERFQSRLEIFEKNKDFCKQQPALVRKEIEQKDKFNEDMQQKYHEMSTESEKAKAKLEALSLNIAERDETIYNLKSSISYVSSTIGEYKRTTIKFGRRPRAQTPKRV